jgi:hypothetical protein
MRKREMLSVGGKERYVRLQRAISWCKPAKCCQLFLPFTEKAHPSVRIVLEIFSVKKRNGRMKQVKV